MVFSNNFFTQQYTCFYGKNIPAYPVVPRIPAPGFVTDQVIFFKNFVTFTKRSVAADLPAQIGFGNPELQLE